MLFLKRRSAEREGMRVEPAAMILAKRKCLGWKKEGCGQDIVLEQKAW